jgi:hypothetical protein
MYAETIPTAASQAWLLSFVHAMIEQSPSPALRSMALISGKRGVDAKALLSLFFGHEMDERGGRGPQGRDALAATLGAGAAEEPAAVLGSGEYQRTASTGGLMRKTTSEDLLLQRTTTHLSSASSSAEEARSTLFFPAQEKFHTFVLAGVRNISDAL